MRLIGAGLPRTGTSSLREALQLLLGAPIYHMSEAFAHPEHAATWVAAIEGEPMAPLFRRIFGGVLDDLDDPDEAKAGYELWCAEVRAEVSPSRLVEWQPGDGWEPLCRALDVPVPAVAFPHENSTASYVARAETRAVTDAYRTSGTRRT